jgi:hypothetical protein
VFERPVEDDLGHALIGIRREFPGLGSGSIIEQA